MRCFSDSVGVPIDTMSKVISCILPPSAVELALQNGDVAEGARYPQQDRGGSQCGRLRAPCISQPLLTFLPQRTQAKSERGEAAGRGGGRGGATSLPPLPPSLPASLPPLTARPGTAVDSRVACSATGGGGGAAPTVLVLRLLISRPPAQVENEQKAMIERLQSSE